MAGNGLAVVGDADDVADETMLAFARETKLSETAFVQAGDDEADYRNRIWTTVGELPFAGHPSLGTAVAVAHRRGERSASYVQRTQAGLQPVDVELEGRAARASMLQGPAQLGAEIEPAAVLGAVGLTAADGDPELAPQWASTGLGHLLVPVAGPEALGRLRPDAAAIEHVLGEHDAVTVYVAACDAAAGRADARSFFLSADGTATEDPATGSAAGPLMAYLHARTGAGALAIDQGVQMGRPSRLQCSVEGDRVRVAGDCVILAEGTIVF